MEHGHSLEQVVAQMLKILVVVTCDSTVMEGNTMVGAAMLGFEKYGENNVYKDRGTNWLVAAQLYRGRVMGTEG